MDYYSLDLQINKEPEGSRNQYIATIMENGDLKVTKSFELRRDLKLTQMLDKVEEKAVLPYPQPKETIHIEFGKMLYNTVFSGELGEYFDKRFSEAQDENCGLRVSLRISEDIPEIAALPWEYLHNGEDFLVTRRSILLSRLPAGVLKTELKPLDSILRMLVVISSPDDPSISPLNTEKEQEIILEAVDNLKKEQKMKVDFTEDATFENVQGYLNEQDYHIVHFTGHGISIEGRGHLVFETEDKKVRLIDNKILADLFSDLGIRLVVLSSCESAKGSNKEAFGDLASMLSKRRIPAVVAMQYSVLDDVAIKFAHTFYKTIANGKPVDLALNEARLMMKDSEMSNGFDFATPVIYLSDCNCVLVKNIKPEPVEFEDKSMMLADLQVMKKGFIARKKELRVLEKGFKSDLKRAAIIHGFGGLGKTVLATQLALKMNDYFDGIFGMKCTSTARPEDILNKINNFLMMKGRFELNQVLNQQVPLEVKTSVLVNVLNQIRFLIILDNFEDCLNEDRKGIENPELKTFIQHILNNTISNTKIIITTRYDFDPLEGWLQESIEHVSLPELHFPQTNWLMNNYTVLADLDIRKKRQIYDVIGGHPWTVGQFARLASTQCVDSLIQDIKPLKKELIEFTLLDKSFSKLDEHAKKLLICASIYEEAVPIEALSWVVGDNKEASPSVGEPLHKLLQWGLISKEQEYDRTIYMEHTIVRDFSLEKVEEEGLKKKELLKRAARYYENHADQTRNVWDILKARTYYLQAEEWGSTSRIVESTVEYLISWGYIELAMNLLYESINTTTGETNTNFEHILATIFYRLGDLNTSLKLYNDVKSKFEERNDRYGLAIVLHSIGVVYQDQGNLEEAVKLFNRSVKMKEELGNRSGVACTLHHLGTICKDQGNYQEAVKMYNQALSICEEIGDKSGIAGAMNQLGTIHFVQGNLKDAGVKYSQSLKMYEELRDKSGIACTLHQLGNIYYSQGKFEDAVEKYNLSLEMKRELGDKKRIATTLHQLGNIHFYQGNCQEAEEMYNQSLKISEEIEDISGISSAQHGLGNVNLYQGNLEEAAELYNQSLEISEEMGNESKVAEVLYQLGKVHESKKEIILALRDYIRAFCIFKELNSPYSQMALKHISELRGKMEDEQFKKVCEELGKAPTDY